MIRPLGPADAAAVLKLLRARPVQNVFLEYVVRAGGLGFLPGFLGCEQEGGLEGIALVAGAGSTALEVRDAHAFGPLAEAASRLPVRPLHIVGPEEITTPFWEAYRAYAKGLIWARREPLFLLTRLSAAAGPAAGGASASRLARLEVARERDLDAVVANSALQYREDLKVDRFGEDAVAFRARHAVDVRDGRWWVLREGRRVVFQAHVGAHNDTAIQVGGVFTHPEVRGRGVATRGMRALCRKLLRAHPAVSLFCDEANAPANALYRRVGFRTLFYYRSFLLSG